jgi:hypothetical protein
MKIKDLVNFALKNPPLLEMELGVVSQTETHQGGPLDGATHIHFHPVQSGIIGFSGFMLFVNPDEERTDLFTIALGESGQFSQRACLGPLPDSLK